MFKLWCERGISLDIVSQSGADILLVKFRAILVNKSF